MAKLAYFGKNVGFADMSLAKGLFPDRGFHYKKGTKQTNKLACPPSFLPPSRLSGVL
jgi:hypothetical protein